MQPLFQRSFVNACSFLYCFKTIPTDVTTDKSFAKYVPIIKASQKVAFHKKLSKPNVNLKVGANKNPRIAATEQRLLIRGVFVECLICTHTAPLFLLYGLAAFYRKVNHFGRNWQSYLKSLHNSEKLTIFAVANIKRLAMEVVKLAQYATEDGKHAIEVGSSMETDDLCCRLKVVGKKPTKWVTNIDLISKKVDDKVMDELAYRIKICPDYDFSQLLNE